MGLNDNCPVAAPELYLYDPSQLIEFFGNEHPEWAWFIPIGHVLILLPDLPKSGRISEEKDCTSKLLYFL